LLLVLNVYSGTRSLHAFPCKAKELGHGLKRDQWINGKAGAGLHRPCDGVMRLHGCAAPRWFVQELPTRPLGQARPTRHHILNTEDIRDGNEKDQRRQTARDRL
jgi:hypothetical protein